MTDEVVQAYVELAIRSQKLPEHVAESVLMTMQDLFDELSADEVIERVKRLRYGKW